MGLDDLKWLRCLVTESTPDAETPPAAYFDFLILMTVVQDLHAWSRLAEPGIAAWLADAPARKLDRLSLASHTETAARFESLGGRDALQRAVDDLKLTTERG